MSPSDFKCQKLGKNEARKLIAKLAPEESFVFSAHAFDRMKERNVDIQDAWNVLESPSSFLLGEGELEHGSFRYRLCTNRLLVVVGFNPSGTSMVVVTVARRSI